MNDGKARITAHGISSAVPEAHQLGKLGLAKNLVLFDGIWNVESCNIFEAWRRDLKDGSPDTSLLSMTRADQATDLSFWPNKIPGQGKGKRVPKKAKSYSHAWNFVTGFDDHVCALRNLRALLCRHRLEICLTLSIRLKRSSFRPMRHLIRPIDLPEQR